MPRVVSHRLLHSVFEPKDYIRKDGHPVAPESEHRFYHKFITRPQRDDDGVSFNEIETGHGRLARKRSEGLFKIHQERERRKWDQAEINGKMPDRTSRYQNYAFLYLDPDEFKAYSFISEPELAARFDTGFFLVLPDESSPVHAFVRFPLGMEDEKDDEGRVVSLRLNDLHLDYIKVTTILYRLYDFFSERVLSQEECEAYGYFTDCEKRDYEQAECAFRENCP